MFEYEVEDIKIVLTIIINNNNNNNNNNDNYFINMLYASSIVKGVRLLGTAYL